MATTATTVGTANKKRRGGSLPPPQLERKFLIRRIERQFEVRGAGRPLGPIFFELTNVVSRYRSPRNAENVNFPSAFVVVEVLVWIRPSRTVQSTTVAPAAAAPSGAATTPVRSGVATVVATRSRQGRRAPLVQDSSLVRSQIAHARVENLPVGLLLRRPLSDPEPDNVAAGSQSRNLDPPVRRSGLGSR